MTTMQRYASWSGILVLAARLIFALVFLMAFGFKVADLRMTAGEIGAAGFPAPYLLAVLAAVFEGALVLALVTGAYFSELMLLGAAYVLFLAFAFHGPSHWTDANGMELGAFVSHFPFAAGLLFAAVHGPGQRFALRRGRLADRPARPVGGRE